MNENHLTKQADCFDALVVEYMRVHRRLTLEELAEKLGCSVSSLWRYRRDAKSFARMPFCVIYNFAKLSNMSNRDLRKVCGLPLGIPDDRNPDDAV